MEMADHAASACSDCTSSVEKREIKPFYVSSGSDAQDRLAFFHILERLKVSLCVPVPLAYSRNEK